MFITAWKEVDKTYWEAVASVRKGLTPTLKLRAVKDIDGNYQAIIRDYSTGNMLTSKVVDPITEKKLNLKQAMSWAAALAQLVFMHEGNSSCVVTNRCVCPYDNISGNLCIHCKIPDILQLKQKL